MATLFGDDSLNDTLYGGVFDDALYGGADGGTGGGNDTLRGDRGDDQLYGGIGNDRLEGSFGDDRLYGGIGNDRLEGGYGNDLLDGGAGADGMVGWAGDDTYYIDTATDGVSEFDQYIDLEQHGAPPIVVEGGSDTVFASSDYTLPAYSERIVSGLGYERYGQIEVLVANAGSTGLRLTGNAWVNTIVGGAGNDVLNGGGNRGEMSGGAGDDTFFVDHGGNLVIEGAGQGADTVFTSLSYSLGLAEVEVLQSTAGAAPVVLRGSDYANTVISGGGNDQLYGGGAADSLSAGDGADRLNGGAGADRMSGGGGNDTYTVDDAADRVFEAGPGGGMDRVYASASFSLPADVEDLWIDATAAPGAGFRFVGNGSNNSIRSGAGNDWIDGRGGADSMNGGAGDDVYYVDDAGDVVSDGAGIDMIRSLVDCTLVSRIENLVLLGTDDIDGTGNASANCLTGNAGNNVLSGLGGDDVVVGGAGVDTMIGGLGNDRFYVDDPADVVVEIAGQGTADRVYTTADFSLDGLDIELLYAGAGAAGLVLTGNGAGNRIYGGGAGDTLIGAAGDDILDGKGGADSLVGGAGNDRYFVDDPADMVVETAGGGTADVAYAATGFALGAGDEVELLLGLGAAGLALGGSDTANRIYGTSADDTLDGHGGVDYLYGKDGDDLLRGGAGNDLLVGGGGADTFDLSVGEGLDRIYDFGEGTDSLLVGANVVVSGLGTAKVVLQDGGSILALNGHLWAVEDFV